MFLNNKHFIFFIGTLIVMMTFCAAANVGEANITEKVSMEEQANYQMIEDSTCPKEKTEDNIIKSRTDTVKYADNQIDKTSTLEKYYKTENTNPLNTIKSVDLPENERTTQDKPKNITLTPENFNTYITNEMLNDNVTNGSYIDVSGKFDGERYAFTINKPVNIFSSRNDAFICFYSTQKLEGNYEIPNHSFLITTEGSGTNVTGITFEDTMIVTTKASNVTFDNLTVYCNSGYGWGLGSTSIRNSENVTIKNSFFDTVEETVWSSTVVFAASQCCLIENCTVIGTGFVGNLVYATTYNVNIYNEYGNSNITIRGNKIIGRNITPGLQTCYSVCLIGDNLTVENNYIENLNGYLVMSQYHDEVYSAEGAWGSLIIRNNTFGPGKMGLSFNPCLIEDNTFYGNVTLNVDNRTVARNNTLMDESQNPYLSENPHQKEYDVIIDAPSTYTYDEDVKINVSIMDTKTDTPVNSGYLEVYADGILYDNITVNTQTTSFIYNNEKCGVHHIRVWYNNSDVSFIQKVFNMESLPITGQLMLDPIETPHIGDTVTYRVSYNLTRNVSTPINITFRLPGHSPITVTAKNNSASITSVITPDYIKKVGSIEREQNIKIAATTGTDKIVIDGITTKLGVQKAVTKITVTPTESKIQNKTRFTAKITANGNMTITGNIVFTDQDGNKLGEKKLSDNTAAIDITFYETGKHLITAAYAGTTHFEASETTVTVKVEKYKTKLTLNMPSTINRTQAFTISGKLTDEINNELAKKKLTVEYGSKQIEITTDANGNYQTTITDLTRSTTVKVTYAESATEDGISTTKPITVKETPAITVKLSSSKVYAGSKVTVTVTLEDMDTKAIANQDITVKIGNNTYSQKSNSNGEISITYTTGTTGTVAVSARYNGNTQYNSAGASSSLAVQAKTKTIITIDYSTDTIIGNTEKITFTLNDVKNKPVSNENINITIGSNRYSQKTSTNGTVTVSYNITGTVTKITASYAGNTQYMNTSTTKTMTSQKRDTAITLSVNNSKACITDTVKVTVTLKDYKGMLLKNQNINVQIGSKSYDRKTGSKGTVSITYKATSSTKITVKYNGDTQYKAKIISRTFTASKKNTKLKLNTIKTVMYKDNVKISGKLTDKNGAVIKQAKVQLKINTKKVTVKTNSKGIFTFTTRTTQTGKNTVTVTYAGDSTYNKATLKSIFTVTKRTTKLTVNKIAKVKLGKKVKVTGKLTDKTGSIFRNCKITIKIDAKTASVKTNSKGIYSYTYTAKTKGTKKVQVNYKGNANYQSTKKTTSFTVTA